MFNSYNRPIKSIFVILISCFSFTAFSQSFKPDQNGYISNPSFHKAIKVKGYQMVGAFDTIFRNPLAIVAPVVLNGKLLSIGLDANITSAAPPFPIMAGNQSSLENNGLYIEEAIFKTDKSPYETLTVEGKYGTINTATKKVGLPPVYDGIVYLQSGYIEIKQGKNSGLAKADGTVIVSPRYNNISMLDRSERPAFTFWIDGKFGMLDYNGKELIKAEYDQIYACRDCDKSGNLLIIRTGRKIGIASKTGKIILSPTYDNISSVFNGASLRVKFGKYYGLIDSLGRVILEPTFLEIRPDFENKILRLSSGTVRTSYGLANSQGEIILKSIYNSIGEFKRGFALIHLDDKVGLVDKSGNLIIKPDYNYLIPQPNGVIATKDDKMGLINFKGQVIIPFSYTKIAFIENNLFYQKGGVYGIMDIWEKVIRKIDYEDVKFTGKYFIVKKNGKFGVLESNLKPVFPIKYDSFKNIGHGFLQDGAAIAMINEISYVIDRYGNQISESEFEAIRSK